MTRTPAGEAPEDREVDTRISLAWKELRRGASTASLRDHLFGTGADALEPGQFDTIEILVRRPAWRMSELADALRVDPSTATRAVQRLQRDGLAERHASSIDRRVVMVSATDAGRARYEVIAGCRRRFIRAALLPFDTDERGQLAELLERLVASVDRVASEASR
jgi:DNA-binding MarR family transcriptional regulator